MYKNLLQKKKKLHAIFGEKTREVRDTSLRVEHGAGGIVHDVKVYTKENSDELPAGVSRHGNKGLFPLYFQKKICHSYQMVNQLM